MKQLTDGEIDALTLMLRVTDEISTALLSVNEATLMLSKLQNRLGDSPDLWRQVEMLQITTNMAAQVVNSTLQICNTRLRAVQNEINKSREGP